MSNDTRIVTVSKKQLEPLMRCTGRLEDDRYEFSVDAEGGRLLALRLDGVGSSYTLTYLSLERKIRDAFGRWREELVEIRWNHDTSEADVVLRYVPISPVIVALAAAQELTGAALFVCVVTSIYLLLT